MTEFDIPNVESSSNPRRYFTQTWRRTRQGYNSTSGPFLLTQSRRQRFPNATSLNNEFRNGTGVRISTQIVRNRLHEFRLIARRPAIPLPLTRQDRLDFVRWTIHDWTLVIFTESRFCFDILLIDVSRCVEGQTEI